MPGISLSSALPLQEFKLEGASRNGDPEEPDLVISCVSADSGLITADFSINGFIIPVIIDSGATASFVSQCGWLLEKGTGATYKTNVNVRTADNTTLELRTIAELPTYVVRSQSNSLLCQFYVIPQRTDLLGYQAIIGIDLMKLFQISICSEAGMMVAKIGGTTIGSEKLLPQMIVSSALTEPQTPDIESRPPQLQRLLSEYRDIFSEAATTCIKIDPLLIPLTGDAAVKVKLRRHSIEDINSMHQQICTLLNNDIIEPSVSSYSSNAHLVPKKNGKKRLVVNFIPLNAITVKDHYPLPQLPDLFNALRESRYFAALDCTEGFFQIPLYPEHKERTAFITPHGLYQFKRCPFGFTNAPAKFQRTMNMIFNEGLYKKCVIYIDDILVFGKTPIELTENLHWVFNKCREFQIKLKESKCQFFEEKVNFLGFQVSFNRIAPIPGKCDPIGEQTPKNKIDVLSVLGTLNYYSRFIPYYAEKTQELRKLTRKDVEFNWTTEHDKQLRELKEELKRAIPQTIPDTYEPKFIEVSIGQVSIEAACFDASSNLIARAGNVMSGSQNNYTPVEKVLVGLVQAYDKFSSFLKGPVTLRTTCKALEPALKAKERSDRVNRLMLQLPPDATFKVELLSSPARVEEAKRSDSPPDEIFYTDGACTGNGKPHCKASWAVLATINPKLSDSGLVEHPRPSNQIAELTAVLKALTIAKEYKLGKIIIVTDSKYAAESMTRWIPIWISNGWKDSRGKPVVNRELLEKLSGAKEELEVEFVHTKGHATDPLNNEVDQLARTTLEQSLVTCATLIAHPSIEQTGDEEIEHIIAKMRPDENQPKYVMKNGQLYYVDYTLPAIVRERLFVPRRSRRILLRISHDDPIYGGHLGIKKTRGKLSKFYWPRMNADIEEYIKSCEMCQQNKNPKGPQYGLLQPIPVSGIFDRLHIDIVGPLQPSHRGHKYIITAIDSFSRYAYAKSVPEVKATDIISFIEHEVITKHGLPSKIVSDNGPQFISSQFKEFIAKLKITHSRTTDYHPQSNGMDERFNGTLVKIMRNYVETNQKDWCDKLIWALMLYNMMPNESTKLSPYSILYGFEPRTPLNIWVSDIEANEDLQPLHDKVRQVARENSTRAQELQKSYYDRNKKPQDFALLDLVMVKSKRGRDGVSRKLTPLWEGPCMIMKIIGQDEQPHAVEVLDFAKSKMRRVPFQLVKHYHDRNGVDLDSDPKETDEASLPGDVLVESMRFASHEMSTNDSQNYLGSSPVRPVCHEALDHGLTDSPSHEDQPEGPNDRECNDELQGSLDGSESAPSFSTLSILERSDEHHVLRENVADSAAETHTIQTDDHNTSSERGDRFLTDVLDAELVARATTSEVVENERSTSLLSPEDRCLTDTQSNGLKAKAPSPVNSEGMHHSRSASCETRSSFDFASPVPANLEDNLAQVTRNPNNAITFSQAHEPHTSQMPPETTPRSNLMQRPKRVAKAPKRYSPY